MSVGRVGAEWGERGRETGGGGWGGQRLRPPWSQTKTPARRMQRHMFMIGRCRGCGSGWRATIGQQHRFRRHLGHSVIMLRAGETHQIHAVSDSHTIHEQLTHRQTE